METPDPPSDSSGAWKKVLLDILRILRVDILLEGLDSPPIFRGHDDIGNAW